MMYQHTRPVNKGIDWIIISLYVALILIGWLSIFAATYDETQPSIFDIDRAYGRQFLWIIGALVLAGAVLLIDSKFYPAFAYVMRKAFHQPFPYRQSPEETQAYKCDM